MKKLFWKNVHSIIIQHPYLTNNYLKIIPKVLAMSFKEKVHNKILSKNKNNTQCKQMIEENKILKYKLKDLKFQNKNFNKNINNLIKKYELNINDLKEHNKNLSIDLNNEKKQSSNKEKTINQLTKEKNKLLKINSQKENNITQLTKEKNKLQKIITENDKIINQINEDYELLLKKLNTYKKQEIINKVINKDYSNLTISIKSAHTQNNKNMGDYFFALSLKESFEKLGFKVLLQARENWYDTYEKDDITIVLRGLKNYEPHTSNINLLWNISHPELITNEEFEKYDIVFISSIKYANKIKKQINTNVKPLLQCTDPNIFFPEPQKENYNEILFVGNTRNVYRQIIKDALNTHHDISIYGMGWKRFIDKKYITGHFIRNKDLHKYYSSCKILLNDHWEDMKNEDFPSNRLFDALACGTFIISDKIPSAETLFEGSIITYENTEDLEMKIDYYLNHENERIALSEKGREIVLKNHTFDKRVEEILTSLNELELEYQK